MGRPVRASTSRLKPRLRPVTKTTMTASPRNRPARWLVIVAVGVGHQLGTSNVNSYDPGQSGRAERVLDRPVVQQPNAESVLVQGRSAGQTYASDPEMRQAVRDVVAALRALPKSATGI